MEQLKAPYKSPYKQTEGRFGRHMSEAYFEVSDKVAMDLATTEEIPEYRLPLYLSVASATGFKVKKIAEEGEEYPIRGPEHQPTTHSVTVKGEGNIAVCIEKPKARSMRITTEYYPFQIVYSSTFMTRHNSYNDFRNALRSLEQEQV